MTQLWSERRPFGGRGVDDFEAYGRYRTPSGRGIVLDVADLADPELVNPDTALHPPVAAYENFVRLTEWAAEVDSRYRHWGKHRYRRWHDRFRQDS